MQENYLQVLIQWAFFFALMSIIIVPAILFRKIALKHNKKGWLFFLFGIAVGVLALNIGRLALYPLTKISIAADYQPYLVGVLFVVSYAIIYRAVIVLRERFDPKDNNDSLDGD